MLSLVFLITGVLLLVLESTVLHVLPIWAGRPDLLFLLTIFVALRLDMVRGALLVFFFGLLLDIVSGLYLGLHPVAFLLVFMIAKLGSRSIPLAEKVYRVPLATLLYVIYSTTLFYVAVMIGDGNADAWRLSRMALQTAVMVLCAFPTFRILDGLHSLCRHRPRLSLGRLGSGRGNRFRF